MDPLVAAESLAEPAAPPTSAPPLESPHWFFTSSRAPGIGTIGEKREQARRAGVVVTLKELFPDASEDELTAAIEAGGDLTVIVDRLLAAQFSEQSAQPSSSASGAGASSSSSSSGAGGASSSSDGAAAAMVDVAEDDGAPGGPKRRVRFAPKLVERFTMEEDADDAPGGLSSGGGGSSGSGGGGGGMSRLSDEELSEQMALSGIHDEPSAGSARLAARTGGSIGGVSIEALLSGGGTLADLRSQHPLHLARGALRIDAKIIKTANEIEAGYIKDTIITFFVIEIYQLGIRWEVRRRYSEFHRFHELLTLQWADLPILPPKLLLSQDSDDVAQRMVDLDKYLKQLLGSPAVALSPLVCTFLDATDVQSFRAQILPQVEARIAQMEAEAPSRGGDVVPRTMLPTAEEAPNGW